MHPLSHANKVAPFGSCLRRYCPGVSEAKNSTFTGVAEALAL